VAKKAVEEAKA